ncbi:hypothetical protein [Pedobacter sp.]|uniref:hypothetical protein n=1 Tax=Pedobacter sp. TaxID=1411316 RepID=UPI0031D46229
MDKLKPLLLIFSIFLIPSLAFGQNKILKALTPDYINLQYGGSIGYVSGGAGYHFLSEKISLSINYGFVPASKGGSLNILTPKFDYKPFKIQLGQNVTWRPINPGLFISYTLGRNFDKKFDPNQYPDGYYWWSTALKIHLGFSTEVKISGGQKSAIKAVGLYAETNTNDLYLISWFENRTTTPITRIFFMGYGVRLYL